MITDTFGDAAMPANIDDCEISPDTQKLPTSREAFTDMSFPLMCNIGCATIRCIAYVSTSKSASETIWQSRQESAETFKKTIWDSYLRHCNTQIPLHALTVGVCDIMSDTLVLHAYRPLHIDPQIKSRPKVESSTVLATAVGVLQTHRKLTSQPFSEPWRWFIWPQWHALAIAIAELCVQTQGPLVEAAWEIVDYSFQETPETVADSRSGMLWQPIQKLMKKAKQTRRDSQSPSVRDMGTGASRAEMWIPYASPRPETTLYTPPRSNSQPAVNSNWDSSNTGSGATNPEFQALNIQDGCQALPSFTDVAPDSLALGASDLNNDMGWMNWESFVEGVDFSDEAFSGFSMNSLPLVDGNSEMETGV